MYRCWHFNVNGAGGSCRTSASLTFNADGSYSESSTRGTWSISGDRIMLSASTVRGPGRISGKTIVFDYTLNGQSTTATYLLLSGSPVSSLPGAGGRTANAGAMSGPPATTPSGPAASDTNAISLEVTIRLAKSDGSIGWIESVILVPEGQIPEKPVKYYRTEAVADRATWSVRGVWRPPLRAIPAGQSYDVWVDTGMEKRRVGKVDLRLVHAHAELAIDARTVERRPSRP